MQHSTKMFGGVIATVGLYLAIGCTSTTTGNEGNLDFSYVADDDIRNFNKPIAVGARLQVRVKETGTSREVDLEDAMSEDNDVLTVETFSSDRLILVGTGEGTALIEVSAKTPSGEVVTDSINMLAAVPDTLRLYHSCGEGGKYFVNTDGMIVGYDMKKSNGQNVIGYGYFPFEVTGDAELKLDETSTDQANFHFDIGSMPGTATIASTIDDTTLEVGVVLPSEVDGVDQGGGTDVEVQVDSTKYVRYFPTVAGDRVCQSEIQFEVATSTPDICDVRAIEAIDADSADIADVVGNVAVEGKALGNCEYTVTFSEGADGAGVTGDFRAVVKELVSPDPDEA